MEALTPWHLLLILIAFVMLAGYKKLPDAARSVGRSLRIFRSEMHAHHDDQDPTPALDPSRASPAEEPTAVSAEDLEREAAEAEELAAQLRARLASRPEDRPTS